MSMSSSRGGTVTITDGPNVGHSVYDPDFRPLEYPKDVRGTVLRKNKVLMMSYRDPNAEPLPAVPPVSVWGNVKSDVTDGNEGIYKRSYY